MIEKKKEIAQEIAYMFLFGDISTQQGLSSTIAQLYTKNQILFRWRSKRAWAEAPFVYLASKYIFGIDLKEYKPFRKIAEEDSIIRSIRETKKVEKEAIEKIRKKKLATITEMVRMNLSYRDLNLISEKESADFYFLILKEFPGMIKSLAHLIQGYIGSKILEGILDGRIRNRKEKEELKIQLAELYLIPAPSDREIYKRHVTNNTHINPERFKSVLKLN